MRLKADSVPSWRFVCGCGMDELSRSPVSPRIGEYSPTTVRQMGWGRGEYEDAEPLMGCHPTVVRCMMHLVHTASCLVHSAVALATVEVCSKLPYYSDCMMGVNISAGEKIRY